MKSIADLLSDFNEHSILDFESIHLQLFPVDKSLERTAAKSDLDLLPDLIKSVARCSIVPPTLTTPDVVA